MRMALLVAITLVGVAVACSSAGSDARAQAVTAPPDVVPVNDKVLGFINARMGTTVGVGDCYALVSHALHYSGAEWDHYYHYGIPVSYETEEVRPGDIVQFLSVIVHSGPNDRYKNTFGYPMHTGVVYKIIDKLHYVIAHQNYKKQRFVLLTEVNFNDKRSGQYWIYRPFRRTN
ncbi:MAG TPA: hypothetical protein PLE73_09310 [Spirochaetota bacterium]|nr:hypothetical protein [Spirochaetota bacterium]